MLSQISKSLFSAWRKFHKSKNSLDQQFKTKKRVIIDLVRIWMSPVNSLTDSCYSDSFRLVLEGESCLQQHHEWPLGKNRSTSILKTCCKGEMKHQVQKHWMQHRWVCWPLLMSPCFGCHQCLWRWCESKLQRFELSGPPYKSNASRFSHHNFLSTTSTALIPCVGQRPVHRAPGGQRGGSFQPPSSPLSDFSCPELSNPPSPLSLLVVGFVLL